MGRDKQVGLEEVYWQDYELLVFSSVKHHLHNDTWIAHGGFVREIDIWAKIFKSVVVAAVCANDAPAADEIPYRQANVRFESIGNALFTEGIIGKTRLSIGMFKRIRLALRLLRSNTVVMARGPDGVGFLGYLLTRFSKRPRFAKYAGQWETYRGEPFTYRFQRALYRASSFGGPVIVNTVFDPARPHIVPLLNASISRQEWDKAGNSAQIRIEEAPYRLLLVGRLSPAKGVDTFLRAVRELLDCGESIAVDIVGDGPERARLEALASDLHIEKVQFRGWVSREELNEYYASAFCLVSCSRHQGLDKVIIEAMSFALPIVATRVSVIPSLLLPSKSGVVVEPDNVEQLTQAIQTLLHNPKYACEMGKNGRAKASDMLIDDQEARYRDFLNTYLKLKSSGV